MIKSRSLLYIIDNCGGRKVKCIKLFNKYSTGYATIGDVILVSLKSYRKAIKNRKVKRKSIYLALIVTLRKKIRRYNGMVINSLNNNVVLLTKERNLIGKRIRGSVFMELRQKGFSRIVSIAENVI